MLLEEKRLDEKFETYGENCKCIMVSSTSKKRGKVSHKQEDSELPI